MVPILWYLYGTIHIISEYFNDFSIISVSGTYNIIMYILKQKREKHSVEKILISLFT